MRARLGDCVLNRYTRELYRGAIRVRSDLEGEADGAPVAGIASSNPFGVCNSEILRHPDGSRPLSLARHTNHLSLVADAR